MDPEMMINSEMPTNKDVKNKYSRMGFAICAFVFLFNALVISGQLLMLLLLGEDKIDMNMVLILNIVVELLIAFPVYLFISRKAETNTPEKKSMKFKEFISTICIMYTAAIAGSLIGQFVNSLLSSSTGKASDANLDVIFENSFMFAAFFSVIIAPVIEELVFRKILIDKLHVYSKKYALIISGLSFGLMHGNLEQFFYTFLLGMLFAFVYIKTGKIKYTIILHCILNGVSVLLQFVMSKVTILNDIGAYENMSEAQLMETLMGDETQLIAFLVMGMIAITEYVLAFIGAIIFIKNRRSFVIENSEGDANFMTAFINKGMIIAIVVMLVAMLIDFML